MEFPADLKYSKEHEWVRVEGDVVTIGITEFAQDELGDIVYVEQPKAGSAVQQNKVFGSVESVKTVSDLYSPLSGEIIEINDAVISAPEMINKAAYDAWIIKVKANDLSELDSLLSAEDYRSLIGK